MMPAKRTDLKKFSNAPRHGVALETARATALARANEAALTKYTSPEQGKDNPTFRRVYVQVYATVYATTLRARTQ